MSFQEKNLEKLIVEDLLGKIEGFKYVHGDNLDRSLDNLYSVLSF